MAMTITPDQDTEFEPSGRRRKITKFALAGVAVLGVGAALTSAAWSDNVFFQGAATTAEFELEGYNPTTGVWDQADTSGLAAIQLPSTAFENVGPGIADSYTVTVRNGGALNITLMPVKFATAGSLFGGGMPAVVTYGSAGYVEQNPDGVLVPGEQATLEVLVTGDAAWDNSDYMGRTGTVTVQIEAQSAP